MRVEEMIKAGADVPTNGMPCTIHDKWDAKAGKYIEYEKPQLAKNPDNFTFFKITKRKDGSWRTTGSDLYVSLNQWHKYYCWEM